VSSTLPGALAAVVIAAVAWPLGEAEPVVGAPVFALVIGVAVGSLFAKRPALLRGSAFTSRYVLQLAIVVLGATLKLGTVASVGASSLPVVVVTLAAAFAVATTSGRLLRIPSPLRTLIGVGTGICGASAIAAVSAVVEVTQVEIAYAISTIFAFNLVAVVVFPPLGHLLGMSQSAFGLWSGTAINDTSSVVAAAYAYGHAAGAHAVLVKLTRTLAIVPIVVFLSVRRRTSLRWSALVPWFLVWFLLAATAGSTGLVPSSAHHALQQSALVLITVALAAVGLGTSLGEIRRAGWRPFALGAATWAAVAATSLVVWAL
jgi:uncharacterized integral membrane protein (TIGR00698 family)